ncbi:MAG: DUF6653 family protein, partial [Pseudomonadota bacterium]
MTRIYHLAEALMGMDARTWQRHANPWSAFTRFTALPLLVLALWSRVWIGWGALPAVALAVLWIWLNPRMFAPPRRLDSWAARGVMGERVFLHRRAEVTRSHRMWADGLALASVPGLIVLVIGVARLDPDWTVFGTVLTVLPKV